MYKYRVDEETSNKVKSIAEKDTESKINDLIENLKDYDDIYNLDKGVDLDRVDYTRLEDVVIDKDAIKKESESELQSYKEDTISKINADTEAGIEDLEEKKSSAEKLYSDSMAKAKDYYSEVKENASDDAIRRGLARSSIVINKLDAFDKAEIAKYNELNDELTTSIKEIDDSISSLQSIQRDALKKFDIEYAVKLQDKINSKTKDLEEKQREVVKYNNQIAEKENEYNTKYAQMLKDLQNSNWDKEKDMMDYAGKYGVNMLANYKSTQKYNIAVEYLDSISKSEALHQLNTNTGLRELLGGANVEKLIKKYS